MKQGKLVFSLVLALATIAILGGCSLKLGGSATAKVDGGIWKSIDSGANWTQTVAVPLVGGKTASIADVDVIRMTFDPQDHNTIYLSTESDGIIYTYNGGASWQKFQALNQGKVRAVAVDPVFKCTLYALAGNKLYKSDDCGRFWENVYFHQNSEIALMDVTVDHANKAVVYLGTSDGEVMKSSDGGLTWKTVNYIKGAIIMDIIVDPNDHKFVYVATDDKGIIRSADGGETWVSLADKLKSFSGSNKYIKMAADKATAGSLIHVSRYGILKSADRGDSWTAMELLPAPKNTSIYTVAVNPKDSKEIYYSTDSSLVKTTDGGSNWSSQKLPFNRLNKVIGIDPQNANVVYLGAFAVKN